MNERRAVEHDAYPDVESPNVELIEWSAVGGDLDAQGWSTIPNLLSVDACRAITSLYGSSNVFRSRIIMDRHHYGRGEYQYFSYPLPALIEHLRERLYSHLVSVANRWHEALHNEVRFPVDHAEFIKRCRLAGQTRPTPLLLRYGEGDYNRLHQDLYGEHVFPLQVAVLLSEPGTDFDGGEFVLTEQRPRVQSRVTVVPLHKGDAVVFAVNHRPVQAARGNHRVTMRHGVSEILAGLRHTLGIIFHDAL